MTGGTEGEAMMDGSAEEVVEGIRVLKDQYHDRAKWHRRCFRSSGIVIILLSATLPLLAGLDYDGKDVTIGVIGVAIAVLTALRNFYQWDQLWSLLRQSDFELTYLLDQWQLDVTAIKAGSAPDAPSKIYELTLTLREAAEKVRRAESTRYFGSLRFPSSGGQQQP
jgi:hypothetical protein